MPTPTLAQAKRDAALATAFCHVLALRWAQGSTRATRFDTLQACRAWSRLMIARGASL